MFLFLILPPSPFSLSFLFFSGTAQHTHIHAGLATGSSSSSPGLLVSLISAEWAPYNHRREVIYCRVFPFFFFPSYILFSIQNRSGSVSILYTAPRDANTQGTTTCCICIHKALFSMCVMGSAERWIMTVALRSRQHQLFDYRQRGESLDKELSKKKPWPETEVVHRSAQRQEARQNNFSSNFKNFGIKRNEEIFARSNKRSRDWLKSLQ